MPTLNQLSISKVRKRRRRKVKRRALRGHPQKKGVCIAIFTTSPKKPNSAIRKMARVRLTNKHTITASIPGIGHSLQKHSVVLVRGGRVRDVPGTKYKLIRGKYDFVGTERINRNKGRSKYGIKKPN
ncbi:UNVERIFIED_CONTAM: hypothetical protein GTU68_065749 [Idotea baltica]|nr:hypothetical protein [Idotea baltica]